MAEEEQEKRLVLLVRLPPDDLDDEDEQTRLRREQDAMENLIVVSLLGCPADPARVSVHEARAAIALKLGIPAHKTKQFHHVEGGVDVEVSMNLNTLASYGIGDQSVIKLQWRPEPEPNFPLAPLDTRLHLCSPLDKRQFEDLQYKMTLPAEDEDSLCGVHIWRVHQQNKGVDLVIEGPPGSFYSGGEFVLRVAYSPFKVLLRMMTPMYHPIVALDGVVSVLDHSPEYRLRPYSRNSILSEIVAQIIKQLRVYRFRTAHAITLRACGMLTDKWEENKEEAQREAFHWTRLFATDTGRRYRRQHQTCNSLSFLAALMKLDPEMRDEVRAWLLLVHRARTTIDSTSNADGQPEPDQCAGLMVLGAMPKELVHMVLLHIGSDRWQMPSDAEFIWQNINQCDDGLPTDWRTQPPEQVEEP